MPDPRFLCALCKTSYDSHEEMVAANVCCHCFHRLSMDILVSHGIERLMLGFKQAFKEVLMLRLGDEYFECHSCGVFSKCVSHETTWYFGASAQTRLYCIACSNYVRKHILIGLHRTKMTFEWICIFLWRMQSIVRRFILLKSHARHLDLQDL